LSDCQGLHPPVLHPFLLRWLPTAQMLYLAARPGLKSYKKLSVLLLLFN